jgi:hypothetical protein
VTERKRLLLVVLFIAVLVGLASLLLRPREAIFHGKPERSWVTNIIYYGPDEQTAEWRAFGPDGIRLLGRALDHSNTPLQRRYRKAYHQFAPRLPSAVANHLPPPADARAQRMCVLSLLIRLSPDSRLVEPSIARAMDDDNASVRQLAIGWYETGLPLIGVEEKKARLPVFLRAMEDDDHGVRNNAAAALRHYSDQARTVAPALVRALPEPDVRIQIVIARTLAHVDREAAVKAGAVSIGVKILKNPDDQIAYRAAELLGELAAEPAVSVPVLIEAAQGSNTLVACSALRSLVGFPEQQAEILPVLTGALNHPQGPVRRAAQNALTKIEAGDKVKTGVR